MATFRIKISDGTTTLDLYSGTDAYLMEGGLNMPPPQVKSSFVEASLYDGARLGAARYGHRTIALKIKIVGTTLVDLSLIHI